MSEERRRLGWGETPWDDMPREDLLRHVQRLYAATLSARGTLRMLALGDPSPFWSGQGTGGRAIAKCEHAMREAAPDFFEAEGDLYDSFYRYAVDLLFPDLGRGWTIGDCGHLFGHDERNRPTTECFFCKKPMRPFTWADMKPRGTESDGMQPCATEVAACLPGRIGT